MELYNDILAKVLAEGEVRVTFPELNVSAGEAVEGRCFKALKAIRAILDDDRLDDPDCFERIEEIVSVFEELGSTGGSRHDF